MAPDDNLQPPDGVHVAPLQPGAAPVGCRRLAVLGASGQIGDFLLPLLVARGHALVALSRDAASHAARQDARALEWRHADLYAQMPPLADCDGLLSLGPLDALVAWLERAPLPRPMRIVAFSSMSALSKRDSASSAERALSALLRDSEARLFALGRAHGHAVTVLRPTLIWGAGRDRSLAPLARLAARWHVMPIPFGARGLRQPVHAGDLAQACVAVLDNPATYGRTYALGGGERLTFRAMCRRMATTLPDWTLPLPVPVWLLGVLVRLRGARNGSALTAGAIARLRCDLLADNAAAAADFGYAPRGFSPTGQSWTPPPA